MSVQTVTGTSPRPLPRLVPVSLEREPNPTFRRQLEQLIALTGDRAEWLPAITLGDPLPDEAGAAVICDLSVLAYRQVEAFAAIGVPVVIVTSEFGTVSMWDWEIRDFLRRRGVATVAPTSLQEWHDVCRALATREQLSRAVMLTYLDDLGAGKQADIFKRFFFYEPACAETMERELGVRVERRSFRELAARADAMDEDRVTATLHRVTPGVPMPGLAAKARRDALRLYLALCDDLDATPGVIAAGINCLNESATSVTTPCLAWNLLYEERGLIWGCEADLTSMLTEYLVHTSLDAPVLMSNLYPFLMGDAALKHERIPYFPSVPAEPENHILVAHCGFLGVLPQSFATEWNLRPPVLEIVDDNAHAIDARMPEGPITIVKITSTMDTLTVTPAALTHYAEYENSDCLNGAVLRVADGYRYVERLPSHHAVIATGDLTRRLDLIAPVLGLGVERI